MPEQDDQYSIIEEIKGYHGQLNLKVYLDFSNGLRLQIEAVNVEGQMVEQFTWEVLTNGQLKACKAAMKVLKMGGLFKWGK